MYTHTPRSTVDAWLREEGFDLDALLASGQLEIEHSDSAYLILSDGGFKPGVILRCAGECECTVCVCVCVCVEGGEGGGGRRVRVCVCVCGGEMGRKRGKGCLVLFCTVGRCSVCLAPPPPPPPPPPERGCWGGGAGGLDGTKGAHPPARGPHRRPGGRGAVWSGGPAPPRPPPPPPPFRPASFLFLGETQRGKDARKERRDAGSAYRSTTRMGGFETGVILRGVGWLFDAVA